MRFFWKLLTKLKVSAPSYGKSWILPWIDKITCYHFPHFGLWPRPPPNGIILDPPLNCELFNSNMVRFAIEQLCTVASWTTTCLTVYRDSTLNSKQRQNFFWGGKGTKGLFTKEEKRMRKDQRKFSSSHGVNWALIDRDVLRAKAMLLLSQTRRHALLYRSGTVNSKSFVGKVLLRIKRKFELN